MQAVVYLRVYIEKYLASSSLQEQKEIKDTTSWNHTSFLGGVHFPCLSVPRLHVGMHSVLFGDVFHVIKVISYQEREWPSHSELVIAADEVLLAFGSGEKILSVIMSNRRNVFGNVKERRKTFQEIS